MGYLESLNVKGKSMWFPLFLPDGTRAVTRSLDSLDVQSTNTEAMVVNTYHLLHAPGTDTLIKAGGVAKFMHWPGLVVSDSGGFQIMSLIHQHKVKGKITQEGLEFIWRRNGSNEKIKFTPEQSIQTQFAIGADIMVVLDYFTDPGGSVAENELSVALTIDWAKRSQDEFHRQLKLRRIAKSRRPLLMGVVQGGRNRQLRQACAKNLVDMDFDLYGYGGWPIDSRGKFDNNLFKFNAGLTPDNKPRFALGVGKPEDIVAGVKAGYHFFDCVLPTRDARHYRLYLFKDKPDPTLTTVRGKDFYRFLYIDRASFSRDCRPISEWCSCYTCKHYHRAYLHHLFMIKDSLAWRLATIHNLFFYQSLIKQLRKHIEFST